MLDRSVGWWSGAPFGVRGITRLNTVLALVLSGGMIVAVSGVTNSSNPQGGVLACAAALLLVVPVAWRRDHALSAMGVIAFGALFNWLVVGHYARCGAALPALALSSFSVGSRCNWSEGLIGTGLAVLAGVSQAQSDPQLKGFAIGAVVFAFAFIAAGRLVRSRERMVAQLRQRNVELRAQRERTARLAVQADQARMSVQLNGTLGQRLGMLTANAAAAQDLLDDSPARAYEHFSAIEQGGRDALTEMRTIVGALHEDQRAAPQPSLADLPGLIGAVPNARLIVEGEQRWVPAGVSLSAYRVVERLLEPFEDAAEANVLVTVRIVPETLEIAVRGRGRPEAEMHAALAAAREWAGLHAGTVESGLRAGVEHTDVRLPLITAYA
jgi:hypothetical protein